MSNPYLARPCRIMLVFLTALFLLGTSGPDAAMAHPAQARADALLPAEPVTVTGSPITYLSVTPLVLQPGTTAPVEIRVETDAAVDEVRLVFLNGSEMVFTPQSRHTFTLSLATSTALAGYNPAHDVHRHSAGYLDVYDGGIKLARYGMHFNVADEDIPNVPVALLARDVQASPHLVNIRYAAYFTPTGAASVAGRPSPTTAVVNRFYDFLGDDYDFLLLLQEPSRMANRHYMGIRNDIQGIGLTIFDASADYGSSGRLQGIVYYPLSTYYDGAEETFSHEIGHRWMVFLKDVDGLLGIGPHWPVSTLAQGIMGYNSATSSQGLSFPYTVQDNGNGTYTLTPAQHHTFNDMELYLMGLVPPQAVGDHIVFVDQEQTLCNGCILQGPVNIVRADDIIKVYGQRAPSYARAQREFRVASIIVTRDRLLSPREMAFFDYFASRAQATEPLPVHIGWSWETNYPFHLATQELASVWTELVGFIPTWAESLYLPLQARP
ncbi:MAG: hypothetical protein D6775_03540 [Caldilineae bacterium]|nr:MAG: hypothetical protein D6775_03540 [Caldilineae bacterium]